MLVLRQCRKKAFNASISASCLFFWLAASLSSSMSLAGSDFAITEVAPGIYLHQGVHEQMSTFNHGDIANSGFIMGSAAVAVVDPGGSVHNAHLLYDAIRAHTSLPVRYVVLTHIHPDHVAGVSVFPASSEVIAHTHYPRALAQRGNFYFDRFPDLFGGDRQKGLRVPDTLVDGELRIDLGERQLLITAYPTAHTDNDLSVLDVNTKTLFASDLLFAQRTPSLDGSLSGWLQVLQRMEGEDYGLVIPGHGQPGSWATVAAPQINYLNALKLNISRQIERGFTLSETIANEMNSPDTDGWQLFDEVHPVNVTKAYTELEWD